MRRFDDLESLGALVPVRREKKEKRGSDRYVAFGEDRYGPVRSSVSPVSRASDRRSRIESD